MLKILINKIRITIFGINEYDLEDYVVFSASNNNEAITNYILWMLKRFNIEQIKDIGAIREVLMSGSTDAQLILLEFKKRWKISPKIDYERIAQLMARL